MALTAWPWTAGRRPTGELPLPGLGGISGRRQSRQPLSLEWASASGALHLAAAGFCGKVLQ